MDPRRLEMTELMTPDFALGRHRSRHRPRGLVHPDATVIGDVIVAAGVYIGPQCVLRSDFGRIEIGKGGRMCRRPASCTPSLTSACGGGIRPHRLWRGTARLPYIIGRNAMVGMNAVVMDEAEIGENTVVAAPAFVKAGAKIPPRSLAVGSPTQVVQELSDQEIDWKTAAPASTSASPSKQRRNSPRRAARRPRTGAPPRPRLRLRLLITHA